MSGTMLGSLVSTVARVVLAPFIRLWLGTSPRSWRLLPTPGERQRGSAPGPDADRVLLIGSGISVGYGVASAELALGGHLARAVAALTRRGASIETVARSGFRVEGVSLVLEEFDLTRFDAVLMTLGSDEALHLVPEDSFRARVTDLMSWVERNAPRRLEVLMVGVPDVTSIMKVPKSIEWVVKRQCARLDAALMQLCEGYPQVTYVPFSPAPANLEREGDRRTYRAWAELLAPGLGLVLDARVADPRDPATIQELRRQLALDDLHILDTPREARFDRIVADARRMFGVGGASITFIDRERQWSKAVMGIDPIDSPRGSALGDATVNNGKLLVVHDASADARFSGHPWVAGASAVRFFAGFPIEAANGERIGALCLCDPGPRGFSAHDDTMLGVLAGQVQVELWGTPGRSPSSYTERGGDGAARRDNT